MAFPSGKIFLFLISPIILHFPHITESQPPDFTVYACINSANYTRNSPFRSYLNSSLSSLLSITATSNGFITTSIGQNPNNTVNALALCGGGVSPQTCTVCVSDAIVRIVQDCPNQMQAVGWYDNCMVRYWNAVFDRVRDPYYLLSNMNNASSPRRFNDAVSELMDRLQGEAAAGSESLKFATGNISGPDFLTIYGLMQCTPDLSEADCRKCLEDSTAQIPVCCSGKLGGRVIGPSCLLRFEVYRSYSETPENPVPQPPPPPSGSPPPATTASSPPPPLPDFTPTSTYNPPSTMKENRTGLIVGVVVPFAFVCFLIALALYCFIQRRPRQDTLSHEELMGMVASPYTFGYAELRDSTNNFLPGNKLGEGGFGSVYKGMLADGRIIAVKQLSVASHHGKSQFVAEISTISAVQHRNLVILHGCCIQADKRLLVYEYMENKSLDQALFGSRSVYLEWPKRFEICMGVARGLAYLHEESRLRIVHRDVKASNILLDSNLNPKISDFGLAKLYDDKKTHMSTRVAGTIGYLAPEYAMRGHLTEKVDVFGFGVVALEIVSGRPNSDSTLEDEKIYLLEWAWNLHESNCEVEMVDESLSKFDEIEVKRVIRVALACTQTSPTSRPSMSRAMAMLSGDIEVSKVTSRPAYLADWKFNDATTFMNSVTSTSLSDTDQFISGEDTSGEGTGSGFDTHPSSSDGNVEHG